MKKKNILTLDIEPDDEFLDIAYLLFHSQEAGYIFADNINRLYRYSLRRIDDMPGGYPFYTYSDDLNQRQFYLIEKPSTAQPSGPWQPTDKLFLIKGEDALLEAQAIYDDFTAPKQPDPDDLLALQHAELRDQMLEEFTVVNLLDFAAPAPTSQRAARDRAAIELHCNQILNYIEQKHLDLPDHERQYLRRNE